MALTASHTMAQAPPLTRPTSRVRRQLRRAGGTLRPEQEPLYAKRVAELLLGIDQMLMRSRDECDRATGVGDEMASVVTDDPGRSIPSHRGLMRNTFMA